MASQRKSHVIRVTGLARNGSDASVDTSFQETLHENFTDEEKQQIRTDITILPSCYDPDRERVALVQFRGGVPQFLSELTSNPLGDWQVEMGDRDINFDRHFFGMTQLYTVEEPVIAESVLARTDICSKSDLNSIIAIAGLDGHAYGSWQGRGNLGRMWLRHFLCRDLPRCRTMIYGYNSKLSSQGVETILDYGRKLMGEIKRIRNTKEVADLHYF